MLKIFCFFLFICFNVTVALSTQVQGITSNEKKCYTHEYYNSLKKNDVIRDSMKRAQILYEERLKDIDKKKNLNRLKRSGRSSGRTSGGTIDTITVVVHICLPSNLQSMVTDEVVKRQIEIINEDFGGYNSDHTNTPKLFSGLRGSANIRFALAMVDNNYRKTNGINRIHTDLRINSINSQDIDKIKKYSDGGCDAWDPYSYLNIWVGVLPTGLLGISTFPFDNITPADLTGVVVNYMAFGDQQNAYYVYNNSNKGRTLTHELGHFFGLYHIWGNETDNYQCIYDDVVFDTPKQKFCNSGTPTFPSTEFICDLNDISTMFMNYMDYVSDSVMNMFTTLQVERMEKSIEINDLLNRLKNSNLYKTRNNVDAEISEIMPLLHYPICNIDNIQFKITNLGLDMLTNFDANLYFDDKLISKNNFSASLPLLNFSIFSIKGNFDLLGVKKIRIDILNPNGVIDEYEDNNSYTLSLNHYYPKSIFDDVTVDDRIYNSIDQLKDQGWKSHNNYSDFYWIFYKNTFFTTGLYRESNEGKAYLETPYYLINKSDSVLFSFDYAAFPFNKTFGTDTLSVFLRQDCLGNDILIFNKYGDGLKTVPSFYGSSYQSNFYAEYNNQWASETVNISKYLKNSNTYFSIIFKVSGGTNRTFISNLSFASYPYISSLSKDDVIVSYIKDRGQILVRQIKIDPTLKSIFIYNSNGQLLKSKEINSSNNEKFIYLDASGLGPDYIFVQLTYANKIINKPMIIF